MQENKNVEPKACRQCGTSHVNDSDYCGIECYAKAVNEVLRTESQTQPPERKRGF